jgi:arylsulfatase
MAEHPNILFFHVDNLGFGELSCYSGGPFRGATTERVDGFAREGFRMTNYCPESQCTPTRSALLTGRHAIRSGTHSVPIGARGGWGLVAWEKTLGDLLSEGGYRCAAYGKWHVGEGAGRWPTDKGFEEWYGPRAPTTRLSGRPTPGTTPHATRSAVCWRSSAATRT